MSELALDGHVDVTDGRIHLNGSRPDHPVLAQTFDNLAPHEGKKLRSRLSSIKHSGWPEVVDHMVETGVLGREKPAAVRTTRHPVTDPAAHAALLADVRSAAAGDGPLEARTAVLLALSGPCHLLEVVAPDRADRKHARRRIDDAADLVPAADAVKAAIEASSWPPRSPPPRPRPSVSPGSSPTRRRRSSGRRARSGPRRRRRGARR